MLTTRTTLICIYGVAGHGKNEYRIKLTEHVTLEKESLDSKYTKYPTRKSSSAFQVKQ